MKKNNFICSNFQKKSSREKKRLAIELGLCGYKEKNLVSSKKIQNETQVSKKK